MMLDLALESQVLAVRRRPNHDQDSPPAGQLHPKLNFVKILLAQAAAGLEPAYSRIVSRHREMESRLSLEVISVDRRRESS